MCVCDVLCLFFFYELCVFIKKNVSIFESIKVYKLQKKQLAYFDNYRIIFDATIWSLFM